MTWIAVLEKLTVAQMANEFADICIKKTSFLMLASTHHRSLS